MCRVLRGLTEWKAIIVVSFLRVIVRANFIHPVFDWFFSFILHIRNIKGGSKLSLEIFGTACKYAKQFRKQNEVM
jgi:hypothetical protein